MVFFFRTLVKFTPLPREAVAVSSSAVDCAKCSVQFYTSNASLVIVFDHEAKEVYNNLSYANARLQRWTDVPKDNRAFLYLNRASL
eukprot:3483027-Amphidinium_carterae.1